MKRLALIFIILILWFVWLFSEQKSNYDYSLTIKVEGKSLDESMRIKDELIKYCEKNKISIEQYAKKEFEQLQYEKSMKKMK